MGLILRLGFSTCKVNYEKEKPMQYDCNLSYLTNELGRTVYLLEYKNKKYIIFYNGDNSCMSPFVEDK
jgi:hypothetical protein